MTVQLPKYVPYTHTKAAAGALLGMWIYATAEEVHFKYRRARAQMSASEGEFILILFNCLGKLFYMRPFLLP